MSYSHGMIVEIPEIRPGYPYKRRLWPAWEQAWRVLLQGGSEYKDGTALAHSIAVAHGLAPATIRGILTRAASAGLLESTEKTVAIEVIRRKPDGSRLVVPSTRVRSFYRIKART